MARTCQSDCPYVGRYRAPSKGFYDEPPASDVISREGGEFGPITICHFDIGGIQVESFLEVGQLLLNGIFVFRHTGRGPPRLTLVFCHKASEFRSALPSAFLLAALSPDMEQRFGDAEEGQV